MLINFPNLENVLLTANHLNERFGRILSVLNGGIEGENIKNGSITEVELAPSVFQRAHPVGSLYFNAENDTNPSTLLGFGTWEMFSAGRVLVGFDPNQTEFNAAQKAGGEKTVSLSASQNGRHNHSGRTNDDGAHSHSYSGSNSDIVTNGRAVEWSNAVDINAGQTSTNGQHGHNFTTTESGDGAPHNNLQPYITVYIWRRVS